MKSQNWNYNNWNKKANGWAQQQNGGEGKKRISELKDKIRKVTKSEQHKGNILNTNEQRASGIYETITKVLTFMSSVLEVEEK